MPGDAVVRQSTASGIVRSSAPSARKALTVCLYIMFCANTRPCAGDDRLRREVAGQPLDRTSAVSADGGPGSPWASAGLRVGTGMVGADGVGAGQRSPPGPGRRSCGVPAGEGADQPRDPQHHQREEGQDDQQGDAATAHVLRLATDDHRWHLPRTGSARASRLAGRNHALTSP